MYDDPRSLDVLRRRADAAPTWNLSTLRRLGEPRRWLPAALVLIAATLTLITIVRDERARGSWGTTEEVLVAERSLEPGESIGADDVRVEVLPAIAVPEEAAGAESLGGEAGTVVEPILAGEVLAERRLAPAGLSNTAAQVPADHRAVALPLTVPLPPLAPGDRVDLLSAADPFEARWASGATAARGEGPQPSAQLVAPAVTVLAVDEASLTVIVAREQLPAVAAALGTSALVPALVGR